MILDCEVARQIDFQEVISNSNAVSESFQIEAVMNRAYQIHRDRGGLIGYDLEDWQQAERELIERNRQELLQVDEAAHAEPQAQH